MSDAVIDLRSDTVTRPTPEMWEAMHHAEVGDDVYGEDPNVNALEQEVASLFGKEAALFVPSGTMANQIALKAQTQPGDEVVAHPLAHIVRAESAGGAMLAGVQFRPVGDGDGIMAVEDVAAVLQDGKNPHFAPTTLICMENTHNVSGGKVVPLDNMEAVATLARENGLRMHMDGARLLNACQVLDVKPESITRMFNSVSLCFSKGLGAPIGSAVAGDRAFITKCLRYRKMYGGGMRQAGILAAAARYALNHNVQRLAEDHANAKLLADGLRKLAGITFPRGYPQTNMVFIGLEHPRLSVQDLVGRLREKGIFIGSAGYGVTRMVTHLDVSSSDIEKMLKTFSELMAA